MRFQDSVFTSGMTVASMLVTGRVIFKTTLEFTPGKMAVSMKANIQKTKSMVLAFITGLMANNIKVGGIEANSMDLAALAHQKARENMVFGKMARKYVGLVMRKFSK